MKDLQDSINLMIFDRLIIKAGVQPISKSFYFYADRLKAVVNYGLVQGQEMIKMICRSAFNDSSLTDNESIVIMETCLDPRLDNILLEVNFNEGWKD